MTTETVTLDRHDRRLPSNVLNTIRKHRGASVVFYDDDECLQSIRAVAGAELATYVAAEPTGAFRSDACRGAMLFAHGGMYFDNDLQLMTDVRTAVNPSTHFVTAQDFSILSNAKVAHTKPHVTDPHP